MEKLKISKFQFTDFKIIKSYFEMGEEDNGNGYNFSLTFSPKGLIDKQNSSFEIELGVLIEEENKKFKAEIISKGKYIFDNELDADSLDKFIYINAPALIFPYIRAFISALTTLSGLKPINLPTLNLSHIGPELKENTKIKE